MEEIKNILKITDHHLLNEIMKITKFTKFKKNDMIANIGDKSHYIYIIKKGIARSYYLDREGNDVTKMFMKENDFCVGESLFEKEPSIQGFEALEDMETWKIPANELKKIIVENHELTQTYMEYLEENLIYKMERESSFQLMSATERYLKFHRNWKSIENRVNQSYIASYLGITPESLSRIKRTIKEED